MVFTSSSDEFPTPIVNLTIDNNPFPLERDLMVEVLEDIEAPSMFAIAMNAWDEKNDKLARIDESQFAPGNVAIVAFGYDNTLTTLLEGEITSLEPEFSENGLPTLTVRGYDRRHRLMRGRKTRSFTEMTDSKIAETIAKGVGLRFQGDTQAKSKEQALPYMLQHNQTDFEFLQQRSQQIGYEFFVEEKALVFRPMQPKSSSTASKPVTLDRLRDEVAFSPRLSAMDQVAQVEVRGWDPSKKEVIVGTAAVGAASVKKLGMDGGPKESKSAFGAATDAIVDRPVLSQAEADLIAVARYQQRAVAYITGDGSCLGNTGIRAGQIVELTGFGDRFSGNYYVTSATHTYSPGSYRTTFSVRRHA